MIFTLKLPAGPHALWSRTAADNMVGAQLPWGECVAEVVKAEVVENGRYINLSLQMFERVTT